MDIDREQLLELLPHYVALILVVLVTLAVVEATFGRLGFWVELGLIFVIAMAYRPVVLALGVAPSAWEE